MFIQELAKDFVNLCRNNDNLEAIRKYYADDIVSVEAAAGPSGSKETRGIEGVRAKNQWWIENHEIHSGQANGPYVGDDGFAVEYIYDFTNKPSGRRIQMQEMALYTVHNGKIVREQFFYNPGA